MEYHKTTELVKRAIELHSERGTSGLRQLAAEGEQEARIAGKIQEYLAKNFRTTPAERCWPGQLENRAGEILAYIQA